MQMTLDESAAARERHPSEFDGPHSQEVATHHWTPKREGSLGGEPTYIQHCHECGAQYRNGRVVWI